jgi:hypothetical protein
LEWIGAPSGEFDAVIKMNLELTTCSLLSGRSPTGALRRPEKLQSELVNAMGSLSPDSAVAVIRDWSERSDPFRWTLTATSH